MSGESPTADNIVEADDIAVEEELAQLVPSQEISIWKISETSGNYKKRTWIHLYR